MEWLGYGIWLLCAAVLFGFGIYTMRQEQPAGFFANVKEKPRVRNVRAYNRAVGRLILVYAVLFAVTGLPLLRPDSALVLLSVVGVMAETIVLIACYLRILLKYQSNQ